MIFFSWNWDMFCVFIWNLGNGELDNDLDIWLGTLTFATGRVQENYMDGIG